MSDVVAFLEARLAEAELLAREALGVHPDGRWTQGSWTRSDGTVERDPTVNFVWDDGTHGGTMIYDEGGHDGNVAEHMVFWQPRRILALVASHRRIIDLYRSKVLEVTGTADPEVDAQQLVLGEVLVHLASTWPDHPDYDPADWTEEPDHER